jgi:hypothetical protein
MKGVNFNFVPFYLHFVWFGFGKGKSLKAQDNKEYFTMPFLNSSKNIIVTKISS